MSDNENYMLVEAEPANIAILVFPGDKLPSAYVPMLFSRWLKSLRYGNELFRKMSSNEYFENYHKFIENLLAKPGSKVRIAALSDDHDIVLGFSAAREDVLDYVHVHSDFRRNGIARSLLPENMSTFTHLTAPWIQIWQSKDSKYKELKFNPFA